MADVHTKSQRSYNMSRIKGRDTKPELLLRRCLWRRGFRYSLRSNKLPGRPDLVLSRYKTVIFIDGCFWHQCPVHFKPPRTNAAFWQDKIGANVRRDKKNAVLLKAAGWNVLRFWEHDIEARLSHVVRKIIDATK